MVVSQRNGRVRELHIGDGKITQVQKKGFNRGWQI